MFDIVPVNPMGRVSSLPEKRKTTEGEEYATFNIACNLAKDVTNFYSITCFGKLADYAVRNIVEVGQRCTVNGSLQMLTQEKDNTVKYQLRVKANFIFPGVLVAPEKAKKEGEDEVY